MRWASKVLRSSCCGKILQIMLAWKQSACHLRNQLGIKHDGCWIWGSLSALAMLDRLSCCSSHAVKLSQCRKLTFSVQGFWNFFNFYVVAMFRTGENCDDVFFIILLFGGFRESWSKYDATKCIVRQSVSWCKIYHGIICIMIQNLLWYKIYHDIKFSIVQNVLWYKMYCDSNWMIVQNVPWC